MILDTQDGWSFMEEELAEYGLSQASLQKREIGEDKPEAAGKSKLVSLLRKKGRKYK